MEMKISLKLQTMQCLIKVYAMRKTISLKSGMVQKEVNSRRKYEHSNGTGEKER